MLTIFINTLNTDEERYKLKAIYEMYYGTMLSVAKSIINDHALAEDAVSDAVMTIIKNLHKVNDIECSKTKAYIVIIVRSRALNLLNRQKKHNKEYLGDDFELSDDNNPLDILTMKESYGRIVNHIRSLPKSLSDVLYLSLVYEHSNKEISKLLNISDDAVRQRLSRAKKQVRIMLAQEGNRHAER